MWVGKKDDSTTLQSIFSVHRWPPFKRRRNEICWRIVTSMLSNCSEMLVHGTYWKTWHSMFSEQTCTINHKMDQGVWLTIISFDLLHSSYMWIQTVLSCGKHCQTMQIGTVSRLRFCRRSWGFKIYIGWNIMRFWNSTESEIISLDAGLRLDGIPALDLWDLIVAVLGNTNQSHKEQWDLLMNKREVRSTPHTLQKRRKSHGMNDDLDNVDFIPSNVTFSRQEALLYVFEDNEAVIKMIFEGRSPTMRHRIAPNWLFDRINLDPKIQIKYIDTKNQLADILTKGNFTRDEWNHPLCLFNISRFSSTDCSEVMSKRTQKDSGEERVTAKSKPMMNLVTRCSERTPDVLASTASGSTEKTRHESQFPLSSRTEQHQRTGRPVVDACSSSYLEWNDDEKWSSQEWKSDEVLEVRTVTLVNEQPAGLFTQHTNRFIVDDDDMDSNTVTQSDLSLKSRSFLHRVNDRVRQMLDQSSKDATKDSNKHSFVWWMLMSSTLEASHGKNYSYNLLSIKNTEDLTMKQMFDISEKLITEQSDEIYGISTINWEDSSWKYLSLVCDEEVISLQRTQRFTYFQILCYA